MFQGKSLLEVAGKSSLIINKLLPSLWSIFLVHEQWFFSCFENLVFSYLCGNSQDSYLFYLTFYFCTVKLSAGNVESPSA